MSRKKLSALVCSAVLLLAVAVLLPALSRRSNCGGNSHALAACKQILIFGEQARGTNGGSFDFARLDAVDQTNLCRVVVSHWTPDAGYWGRTCEDSDDRAERMVVVVCDVAYSNVPQPTIWNFYRRNPAHAVSYADGSVGLISPGEFAAIDLGRFTSLNALATNFSQ